MDMSQLPDFLSSRALTLESSRGGFNLRLPGRLRIDTKLKRVNVSAEFTPGVSIDFSPSDSLYAISLDAFQQDFHFANAIIPGLPSIYIQSNPLSIVAEVGEYRAERKMTLSESVLYRSVAIASLQFVSYFGLTDITNDSHIEQILDQCTIFLPKRS
jgi:hypothetical protein